MIDHCLVFISIKLLTYLLIWLMNNIKWHYLVGECKMDFPIATWIPSFENSFWIYLLDSIITMDVKHLQFKQA